MNSIRLTTEQYGDICKCVLADELEGAAFLIAGYFENKQGRHFAVRNVMVPDSGDYDLKSSHHLQISSKFFNKVIARASAYNMTVIQCHSHPSSRSTLQYSPSDYRGELLSATTVQSCLRKPMGSLLFGPDKVIGRIWPLGRKKPVCVDQMRLVDRRLKLHKLAKEQAISVNRKIYDRQIRAFGIKGQALLSELRIGIVGLGGTGSAVAEQLAREGIHHFVLADNDKFDPSNITRMYGSYNKMRSKYKVSIVRKNIKKIDPNSTIVTIPKDVVSQRVLEQFKDCDIIFSCTDRHRPRSVLNELAHQYFIPVIDMGAVIDVDDNRINEASIRISLTSPSIPCLYCASVIYPEQILAESISRDDLKYRQDMGYIKGQQDNVPSVIPLTTIAASLAVIMLKDLLFGIMNTTANTFILDAITLRKLELLPAIRNDCVCVQRMARANSYPLSAPPR